MQEVARRHRLAVKHVTGQIATRRRAGSRSPPPPEDRRQDKGSLSVARRHTPHVVVQEVARRRRLAVKHVTGQIGQRSNRSLVKFVAGRIVADQIFQWSNRSLVKQSLVKFVTGRVDFAAVGSATGQSSDGSDGILVKSRSNPGKKVAGRTLVRRTVGLGHGERLGRATRTSDSDNTATWIVAGPGPQASKAALGRLSDSDRTTRGRETTRIRWRLRTTRIIRRLGKEVTRIGATSDRSETRMIGDLGLAHRLQCLPKASISDSDRVGDSDQSDSDRPSDSDRSDSDRAGDSDRSDSDRAGDSDWSDSDRAGDPPERRQRPGFRR